MTVKKAIVSAAVVALVVCAQPAWAVEEGLSIYPKGLAGFMSGILPPEEGFYLTNDFYYFQGEAGREVRNDLIEANADVSLQANFLTALFVTNWHVLGATYAYGGAADVAWGSIDATLQTPIGNGEFKTSNRGIGDSILQPIILGWHDGLLNWNAVMNVYVPTGAYRQRELNLGRNVWAFMPQFGFTYFNPKTGVDLSGTLVYVTMSNNPTTRYQSGDILHLDWAMGMHFGAGGAWEAGVNGNVVQQVGSDTGTGAKLGPFKAESVGIGPGISYATKLGATPSSFAVRWERDFDAHNTFKGDVVVASATFVF